MIVEQRAEIIPQRTGITQLIPEELWELATKPERCSLADLLVEDERLSSLGISYQLRSLPFGIFRGLLENLQTLENEFQEEPIAALEGFLERAKIKWGIRYPHGLDKQLKEESGIAFCDHPGQVEAFVLTLAVMKLSGRTGPLGVKGMGVEYLTRLGPNIASVIEPVWTATEVLEVSQKRMSWKDRQTRALVNFLREPGITPTEAGRRTVEAIANLAHHLDNGGIVLITPPVGRAKRGKEVQWATGVGRILSKANQERPINCYPVTFDGGLGLLTLLRGGEITVRFGKPLEIVNARDLGKDVVTETLRQYHQQCFA